jgi:hypothetical protein
MWPRNMRGRIGTPCRGRWRRFIARKFVAVATPGESVLLQDGNGTTRTRPNIGFNSVCFACPSRGARRTHIPRRAWNCAETASHLIQYGGGGESRTLDGVETRRSRVGFLRIYSREIAGYATLCNPLKFVFPNVSEKNLLQSVGKISPRNRILPTCARMVDALARMRENIRSHERNSNS